MNVENMLALSYFLEGLDSDRFDLRDWASSGNKTLSIGEFVSSENRDISCDTSACIAGWAVYLLSLSTREHLKLPDIKVFHNSEHHYNEYKLDNEEYLKSFKYEAFAENWLGLSYEQSRTIFYCDEGSLWDIHSDDYHLNRMVEDIYVEDDYTPIDIKSIHPKHAADLLRRLALGEISFPERW
jgi:hypothetical protein